MIWIKRIASTPAPSGRIIDSFETGDDKSTNAPSIRATLEKLNLKAEIDDSTYASDKTLSGAKIKQMFDSVDGVAIDDTTAGTGTVYSSSKTENFVNTSLAQLKELLYPVGCIVQTTAYSTVNEMREAYGGQDWTLIEDRVLMGAGGDYSVKETGGSDTVVLTTANLPSHDHLYTKATGVGSHTLSVNEIANHRHNFGVTRANEVGYVPANGSIGSATIRTDANGITNTGGTFNDRDGNDYTDRIVYTTGGSGSHNHSLSTASARTGLTGSGRAISIMQPYYTVYIWTRTV